MFGTSSQNRPNVMDPMKSSPDITSNDTVYDSFELRCRPNLIICSTFIIRRGIRICFLTYSVCENIYHFACRAMNIYHQLLLPQPVQIQEHKLIGYQPVLQRIIETVEADISELRVNGISIVNNDYLVLVFLYDIFVFSASESAVVARRRTKRQINSIEHGMSRNVLWVREGSTSECYIVTEHGQLFKVFEGETKSYVISQYST